MQRFCPTRRIQTGCNFRKGQVSWLRSERGLQPKLEGRRNNKMNVTPTVDTMPSRPMLHVHEPTAPLRHDAFQARCRKARLTHGA